MSTFAVDIKSFVEKVKGREVAFLQKLLIEIDSGVVYMTPVDEGRARGNWNVGINNVDFTDQENETNAQSVINRAMEVIKRVAIGDIIYISNNVEYIKFLEDGSSEQAPNGMVALTLQRLQQIQGEALKFAKEKVP